MGCNYSKISHSEVLWHCKKRKRLIANAIKYRQEFAVAQLAYLQTLKEVGRALPLYASRQTFDTEVVHTEKKEDVIDSPQHPLHATRKLSEAEVLHAEKKKETEKKVETTIIPPPLISEGSLIPEPSPSATTEKKTNTPPKPSSAKNPSPVANTVLASKNERTDKVAVMPNGVVSPPIQSLSRQSLDDLPVSSMPNSPINGFSYYSFSQPSSPLSSAWDPFNLFPVFPFASPEQLLSRLKEWDIKTETTAGSDGLPDLEEVDDGHETNTNDLRKANTEQNVGKTITTQNLGKTEQKQTEPQVEKLLPRIDEDSAEEALSPIADTKLIEITPAKGKNGDKHRGPQDVSSFHTDFSYCMKRISDAFEKAVESSNQVSQMLEAQVVHPRARLRDLSDSFGLANTAGWQWPRRTSSRQIDLDLEDSEDDMEHDSFKSHSVTLERLYAWEKKLYKEVKIGEQLQKSFLKKSREFYSIDAKKQNPELIGQYRTDLKSLESQLEVAFRGISSVSLRIQQVTTEELYPQLVELLRRLKIMWKSMLECHKTQKEAALKMLSLRNLGDTKHAASDTHRSVAMELEKQLESWQQHFYLWVTSQQHYIHTLLTWVKICHMDAKTNSRNGAASPAWTALKTPIYMLARNWHDSLLSLEENTQVVNAIAEFSSAVHVVQVSEQEELVKVKMADVGSRSMDHRNQKAIEHNEKQDKDDKREDAVLASLKVHLPKIFGALLAFALIAHEEYEKLHKEAE